MITDFYNTTALYEIYTETQGEYGEMTKTWSVSTFINGCKQGRSGRDSIITNQERISKSEKFYCDYTTSIGQNGRLVFSNSSISFTYQGSASSTGDLTGGAGSLYFCGSSFSTYNIYDYALNIDSTYIASDMIYNNILYVNDLLRKKHLEIDLELDFRDRT